MFDYGELDDAESSELTARVQVEACAAPAPLRSFEIDTTGVWVEVFAEGDQQTFPSEFVEADYVARGAAGCTFDCSAGKGQGPMRMELGHGAIVPGMELALKALSLGAVAQVRIPAALGYGSLGVPNLVPPNCDLYYELRICVVDGKAQPDATKVSGGCGNSPPHKLVKEVAGGGMVLVHPWWLARVERPPPTSYYLSFCQRLELGIPVGVLHRARPIVRKSCREMSGWDLTGSAVIVRGVQDTWKARREWDLEWFQKKLGQRRQLVKWQGPVFTKQERLWEQPIWETSLAEYLDYVQALERADPNCSRVNAEGCPRLYLNGWPAFLQVPWLREYIVNPAFIDDCSGDLIAGNEELRENFIAALTRGYEPPTEAERQKAIDDEYWELSKLFISPKGAITRLHFDNGGAHAWLSQVRGRKLFVCFPPSDGPHLHPFEGDEGLLNGSWLDPLDPDVLQRWPDYARATPYVAVVEEGETLFAPQGWWHYAVALDTSVTVMRNFYSKKNRQEHIQRKDEGLTPPAISPWAAQPMMRFGALISLLVGGAAATPTCEVDTDISSFIQIKSIPASPHSYMVWHTAKKFEAPQNNLDGTGPLDGPEELRFRNVSMFYLDEHVDEPGIVLDLLIQSETPYTYTGNNNGEKGEFGAIQFEARSGTVFRWSFVKTGTYEKVVIPDFAIMFYDLDNKADSYCDENITAWNVHSYALVPDAFTTVTEEAADRLLVCSKAPGGIPNPRAINQLSDDQKKASVMLSFQDTAEFVLSLRNSAGGRRQFQFSGPSSAFLESAAWTPASPTAAPTEPPTVAPTQSPTTGSPTTKPTASPTSSPTSSPTLAEPTAFGDPHVMNIAGEKFNIQRAGNHTFLAIPRGADLEAASLQVHATVHLRGEECNGQLYITEISLLGEWLGNLRSLELSAWTEDFNTPEVVGLRVGESDKVSVEEFINRVSPEIADAQRFAPERPRSVNQHAATLLMRLHLGPLTIKVTWAHTKEKVGFSNSLMLVVAGLANVRGSVGGLLGEDSHAWAASEPANCSLGMLSSRVQALLGRPDRSGVSARGMLASE